LVELVAQSPSGRETQRRGREVPAVRASFHEAEVFLDTAPSGVERVKVRQAIHRYTGAAEPLRRLQAGLERLRKGREHVCVAVGAEPTFQGEFVIRELVSDEPGPIAQRPCPHGNSRLGWVHFEFFQPRQRHGLSIGTRP